MKMKMKQLTIDDQIEAINGSIKKWEGIIYNGHPDRGISDCKCCQMFSCNYGCPIGEFVDGNCGDTPYHEWSMYGEKSFIFDIQSRANANRVLVFLFEVKAWLIRKRYFNE